MDVLERYYSCGILATCIQSVVRVGLSLVICEVSFRSPQGAERSKHEKPCRSSIDSITKVTYWPRFLPNAYEERYNASYRDAVDLRCHSYQDSSWAASRCQREKSKTVHTTSYKEALCEKQLPCASQTLPRYKLSNRKLFNPFSNSGKLCSTSLMLIFQIKVVDLTCLKAFTFN